MASKCPAKTANTSAAKKLSKATWSYAASKETVASKTSPPSTQTSTILATRWLASQSPKAGRTSKDFLPMITPSTSRHTQASPRPRSMNSKMSLRMELNTSTAKRHLQEITKCFLEESPIMLFIASTLYTMEDLIKSKKPKTISRQKYNN